MIAAMAWATPKYRRDEVDDAGKRLIDPATSMDEKNEALGVVNNWRSSHAFPLNTFQMGLRRKVQQYDAQPLIAQRIKRMSSIEAKLDRIKRLSASEIQDYGGCRAVMKDIDGVDIVRQLLVESEMKHSLVWEDDYIRNPKKSGYRGIHLIYEYKSDKSSTYDGLRIEIQIRSQLQHAWATAVETFGTFLKQSLKSSQGDDRWLRFFTLMSSVIAQRESAAVVPNTPTDTPTLIGELRQLATTLEVRKKLEAYGSALNVAKPQEGAYYLLVLRPDVSSLSITPYRQSELASANEDYLEAEKATEGIPGAQAVLVSVRTLQSLRAAYPNYFLDTRAFLAVLDQALT